MNERKKHYRQVRFFRNGMTIFSRIILVSALTLSVNIPTDAIAGGRKVVSAKAIHGKQVGKASWYGPGLHGRKTASGERFNQNRLTAAHPRLPLGSRARVTNLKNGKTVEVTINDRGPHRRGRIIDLSRAAARQLSIAGVANVRVEALP